MQTQPPLLVTGAAGFIGARIVERCNSLGIPLISVDEPSYFSGRKEHSRVNFGKVVDRSALFDWLEKNRPEVSGVLHIGACTDTTELDLTYLNKMNFEYSQGIWNYAVRNKIPLVYASSAATYGAGENGYIDDETLIPKLKPLNPYGDSKNDFDIWALAEEREGRSPVSWSAFKFFNVFGFGETHKEKMSSVVLQAYHQIKNKGQVRLFESHKEGIPHGHQKRDFIYVEDVVDVLFYALEKPIKRGIFNLGSGKARTFLDLAKATFSALEKEDDIVFFPTPENLRSQYQYFTEANMDRLRSEGYDKKFHSLEDGVAHYVARLESI